MSAPLLLITGATGLIGFSVLVLALEAGHRVRASVRSEAKGKQLSSTASLKRFADKVTFVVVEDFTAPDAFREALQGVTSVIHVASPIPSAEAVAANGGKVCW